MVPSAERPLPLRGTAPSKRLFFIIGWRSYCVKRNYPELFAIIAFFISNLRKVQRLSHAGALNSYLQRQNPCIWNYKNSL